MVMFHFENGMHAFKKSQMVRVLFQLTAFVFTSHRSIFNKNTSWQSEGLCIVRNRGSTFIICRWQTRNYRLILTRGKSQALRSRGVPNVIFLVLVTLCGLTTGQGTNCPSVHFSCVVSNLVYLVQIHSVASVREFSRLTMSSSASL